MCLKVRVIQSETENRSHGVFATGNFREKRLIRVINYGAIRGYRLEGFQFFFGEGFSVSKKCFMHRILPDIGKNKRV